MRISDTISSEEYKWNDGGWTFTDTFINWFYRNLRRRDLIFYNVADLDNWNPIPYFRSVRLWVALNVDGMTLGGFWVSSYNPLNKSGFFNCGMVKDAFQEPQEYISVAALGLKALLNRDDLITLYGETSVTNKGILALSEYFGFVDLGTIPNGHYHAKDKVFCDTRFMYINKAILDGRIQ